VHSTPKITSADSLEDHIAMQLKQSGCQGITVEFLSVNKPRTSLAVQHHAEITITSDSQTNTLVHVECRSLSDRPIINRSIGAGGSGSTNEHWVTMATLIESWAFIVSLCERLEHPPIKCSMRASARIPSVIDKEWLDRKIQWCANHTVTASRSRFTLIEHAPETKCLIIEFFSSENELTTRVLLDWGNGSNAKNNSPARTARRHQYDQLTQLFIRCHSFEEAWQLLCGLLDTLNIDDLALERLQTNHP